MNFDFRKEVSSKLLVWFKFLGLPLTCWGEDSLCKIGSLIGASLCFDECTTKHTRLNVTRVLIETNVTKSISSTISMFMPYGKLHQQRTVFEWFSFYCLKCEREGHICDETQPKYVQKWLPKNFSTPLDSIEQVPSEVVVTPEDEVVHVIPNSDTKGGWKVATKVTRHPSIYRSSIVRRSSFVLFQEGNDSTRGMIDLVFPT